MRAASDAELQEASNIGNIAFQVLRAASSPVVAGTALTLAVVQLADSMGETPEFVMRSLDKALALIRTSRERMSS